MHKILSVFLRTSLFALLLGPTPLMAEEVYVIRGFTNVFSNGMNEIQQKLESRGIRATVHSNGAWKTLANDIIQRAKMRRVSLPIIIMGHSLGGVEAVDFANTVAAAGIPVAMIIGVDPGFPTPNLVGPRIGQVLNIKIPSGKNYLPGKGFQGRINTIDASKFGVSHTTIDDSIEVQNLILRAVASYVK
jgi:pimeloyl-ACP methyl ester carboxylesterase